MTVIIMLVFQSESNNKDLNVKSLQKTPATARGNDIDVVTKET